MAESAKYQDRHELPQRTPETIILRALRGEAMRFDGGRRRGLRLVQAIREGMDLGVQA